jgi:Stage II sporulation protein E (SpoIIE)
VAPFHPSRHEARDFVARAGAAFAVFLTIAVVLLAGGSDGALSSAEATGADGAPTAAATPVDVPEPIPPVEPVVEEPPPVEEPPVEEPPPADPPVEDPPPVDPPVEDPPVEGPPVEGPPADEPGAPEEPGSGGGKGDGNGNGNGQGEDPAGGGGKPDTPSGGSKGPKPGEPTTEPAEPGPVGRTPVTPDTGAGSEPSQQPGGSDSDTPGSDTVGPGKGSELRGGTRAGEPQPDEPRREANFRAPSGGGAEGGTDTGDGGTAGASDGSPGSTAAPAAGADAFDPVGEAEDGGDGSAQPEGDEPGSAPADESNNTPTILEPLTEVVRVVPDSLKAALAALAVLSVLLGFGYLLAAMRARRLARQRRELLQEVGLLQTALLPPVPEKLGALRTSVAYRPADGPGAGGDFYDVLPLSGGRVGFILGDVSGHGRGALARTAFMRYTLRAYLEAGLEPRVALQVAGRVIDDNLGGDFATVLLAVHDPETGSLTYATAGHPAPIVVGPQPHEPVTAGSSPPIGVGVRTGLRQTTVPLVPGSVACLFTDGLMEARTEQGILGRERLAELLEQIGDDATARRLIERVAAEASVLSDDMAAVVVSPTEGVTAGLFRTEQLELSARELDGPIAARFLDACGLPEGEVQEVERDARLLADRFGGVVLHVVFGNRLRVEVLPRNVESIEAASRRVTAGSAR